MTLPVVDREGRLLGQITFDDVLDVIQDGATKDIYKMAGTRDDEADHPSVLRIAEARLPWLGFCLFGGLLSGFVIHLFDVTLERVITLTAFIPVIIATGGNSGLQSATVTIRGLVTGQVVPGFLLGTILFELGAATVIGGVCGIASSAVARLWFGAATVDISIMISLAMLLGVITPLVFERLGIDPAIASGPFITTTNDVVGLLIYLSLARSSSNESPDSRRSAHHFVTPLELKSTFGKTDSLPYDTAT